MTRAALVSSQLAVELAAAAHDATCPLRLGSPLVTPSATAGQPARTHFCCCLTYLAGRPALFRGCWRVPARCLLPASKCHALAPTRRPHLDVARWLVMLSLLLLHARVCVPAYARQGAVPGGGAPDHARNTAAIQHALDTASKDRGCVALRGGDYYVERIHPRSNSALHLEAGSRLLCTLNVTQTAGACQHAVSTWSARGQHMVSTWSAHAAVSSTAVARHALCLSTVARHALCVSMVARHALCVSTVGASFRVRASAPASTATAFPR